jgi:hypothetical protein
VSHYIAGGLMLLLLVGAVLLGIEAVGVYNAARMVDAALLDGQRKLAVDGGVSTTVVRLVRERIEAEGGVSERLKVIGSRPGTPFGDLIRLQVTYDHAYTFTGLFPHLGQREGNYTVVRTAATISGWQP